MKTTPFELHGREYHLCMNGAALFDIYDKFGSAGSVTDPIEGIDRKSFDATCWMLYKLSEQGAMVRRYQGHERAPYLREGELRATLTPAETIRAKEAIKTAVRNGFAMEVPKEEPEEEDLWLRELEAQDGKKAITRSQFLYAATQLLHFGVKESLLLTIGEMLDLLELDRNRRSGHEGGDGN